MSWIIPENKFGPVERLIIDETMSLQNLCIKGSGSNQKSIILLYLIRNLLVNKINVRILLLVYNKLNKELYESAFKEIGLRINVDTYFGFQKAPKECDYIFCDNVQLITPSMLTEIANKSNIVIVTLDPYTIWEFDPLSRERTVTMEILQNILHPKIFELDDYSHLSPSLQYVVSELLSDFPTKEIKKQLFKGDSNIRVCKAYTEDEEFVYIIKESYKALNVGYSVGIFLPTHDRILSFIQNVLLKDGKHIWDVKKNNYGRVDFGDLNCYLSSVGIPLQILGSGYGQLADVHNKINVLTYYSLINLEFDIAFLPLLNTNLFINADEQISRNVFILAITRSRLDLYLTYNAIPHKYLDYFGNISLKIDIHEALLYDPQNAKNYGCCLF